MQKQWMRKPALISLLLVGLLIVFVHGLASASKPAESLLPPPIEPEPYPNSDIFPAEVFLATSNDLQVLYDLNIDFEGLREANSTISSPPRTIKPSIATVYVDPTQAKILDESGLSLVPVPNEGYRSYLAYGPGSGAPDA